MKKQWLKGMVLSLLAGSAVFASVMTADAADIRILPVDTAKFWSGVKFDFDVEVSNAKDLQDVDITINGKPAADVLGRPLEKQVLDNGVTAYRANDVTFKKTGDYVVNVTASDAEGTSAAAASYKVVQEKTARPAKNVILFVGDGIVPAGQRDRPHPVQGPDERQVQ